MSERFIYLTEKYFDKQLSAEEQNEFNKMLAEDARLKSEFEEQKRIKEVLKKMKMKNPSSEVWDAYWLGIYRRLERGIAWIAISVGAIILVAYGVYEAVENFLKDTSTPSAVKWGITILVAGAAVLLLSLLREKIFTSKSDKYKEIQR
jgi:hypothetical protein